MECSVIADSSVPHGQSIVNYVYCPQNSPQNSRVFDPRTWADKATLKLHANTPKQNVVCYIDR